MRGLAPSWGGGLGSIWPGGGGGRVLRVTRVGVAGRSCATEPYRWDNRYRDNSQIATDMLALCDMRTLYLRNVPDEVVERLERLAARDRMSLSAVAVRELEEVSRRVDNPALLRSLPDHGIDPVSVVADVDAERYER